MDKTVSISLGGFSFVIDELAYHNLSQYLQDIKTSLRGTEGINDILEDVEIRIAELLKERTRFKEVVGVEDIEHIISVMGRPDQYKVDDEYESAQSNAYTATTAQASEALSNKRFLRDPDDKVVTGLCAGMAHYLGLDPWIVRSIWLTLLLFGIFTAFSALLVLAIYFILAVLVPKATTTSDKLAMFGKPANLEGLKKNALKASEEVSNSGKKLSNSLGGFVSLVINILIMSITVVIMIVGLSLILGAFAVYFMSWFNVPVRLFDYFFEEGWMSSLTIMLCSLLLLIPGVLITLLGVKIMKPTFRVNKLFLTSSVIVWFLSLIGIVIMTVNTMTNYKDAIELRKDVAFTIPQDTIEISFDGNNRGNYRYKFFSNSVPPFYISDNQLYIPVDRTIEIRESVDDQFKIEFLYKASGKNSNEAKKNIDLINVDYEIKGNKLIFNDFATAGKNSPYRKQSVWISLYVPKNKVLKMNSDVQEVRIISQSKKTDFYFDLEENFFGYNGKKFVCLNCENSSDDENAEDEITIDDDGETVNINSSGIQIKSKTGDQVKIDQNQIHISNDTDTLNINYRNHHRNR